MSTDDELLLESMKEFVECLYEMYQTKKTSPINLYYRLLSKINSNQQTSMNKVTDGLDRFFRRYSDILDSEESTPTDIPDSAVIRFGTSDRVYLEVGKFIHRSSEDDQETIMMHLYNLYAILDPQESIVEKLQNLAAKSEEIKAGAPGGKSTPADMDFSSLFGEDSPLFGVMDKIAKSGIVNELLDTVTENPEMIGQLMNSVGSLAGGNGGGGFGNIANMLQGMNLGGDGGDEDDIAASIEAELRKAKGDMDKNE